MKVTVITGSPGSQKTRTMLKEILQSPGHYLVAAPRIDLIAEMIGFLRAEACRLDIPCPELRPAHSEIKGRGSVQRQINDAKSKLASTKHAVVLVTHEGLRTTDLTQLQGWHARIDEVPDSVVSGRFSAAVAYRYLETLSTLEPIGDGKWWQVQPRGRAPGAGQVIKDTVMPSLSAFHKHVRSGQGVFVDVGDWQDAQDGRKIRWWSLWTPLSLKGFASIKITGASFETSLCHKVCSHWFSEELTFEFETVGSDICRASPQVSIYFFTRGHVGSTAYWNDEHGSRCLNRIARYFDSKPRVGFWSGNENALSYLRHWIQGEMVLPKQAGTNTLIDRTSCAFIYSNKAQDSDDAILDVFNLSKEQIQQAREFEDVIQFVMRGAIRRPEFNGSYHVYLYDFSQAEALAKYLCTNGITNSVTLIPVDEARIMDVERQTSQRSGRVGFDTRSKSERDDERKAKARERQRRYREKRQTEEAAAGKERRRPGRPSKKSADTQPAPDKYL